eukprot:2207998-Rhodomonas_salina.1
MNLDPQFRTPTQLGPKAPHPEAPSGPGGARTLWPAGSSSSGSGCSGALLLCCLRQPSSPSPPPAALPFSPSSATRDTPSHREGGRAVTQLRMGEWERGLQRSQPETECVRWKGTQPTADGVLRHHQMQFECSLIIGCPLACGLAAKCPVVTEPLYRGVGKRADFAIIVLLPPPRAVRCPDVPYGAMQCPVLIFRRVLP